MRAIPLFVMSLGLLFVGCTVTFVPPPPRSEPAPQPAPHADRRAKAEPPHAQRQARPEPPRSERAVADTPAPRSAPPRSERGRNLCPSQRAVLANLEHRVGQGRSELAGIDSEIATNKRRQSEIQREQQLLARAIAHQESLLKTKKSEYQAECERDENCEQYEAMVVRLDSDGKPLEEQLAQMRSELGQTRSDIDKLQREIEPLRREYQQKRCNNLVPGETAEETIDRCSAIFSDWNRLQARLNQFNNRLPILKSSYEQVLARLQGLEQRAAGFETYLAKNCKSSKQLEVVRRHRGSRERAQTLHKELDTLISDVARLRGIRISIEGK